MCGLLDRDIEYILKAIKKFTEIEKAIIFGSRAMGNYKNGSDVDLAIVGSKVNNSIIYKLDDYLNDIYPLPYFFDVIHYNNLKNDNLRNHIDTEGKVIYNKDTCES